MSKSPQYVGPGYWTSWHLKSLHCKTFKEKSELSRNIMLDIKFFPCAKCKNDATSYIKKHNILQAIRSEDEMSMFKWVFNFHNHVNKKIGKKTFSYEEALKEWVVNGVCMDSNCNDEEVSEVEEVEEVKIIKNTNSIYLNIKPID